jgi:small GTP-binding protein
MGNYTMSQEYDYLFKCIAVGDGGCGKTALTVRFAHGFFQEQYKMTIGVEFAVKLIEIGGFKTKLQIWDTGGQERFSYVRPLYYKGAMGALCVFDLTNRESFDHVPNWIDEVKANVGEVPMVLVGNKADLPGREVPRDEAEGTAKKFNMYYLESSAKTGDGVGDCFGVLAAMMIGIEPPAELLSGRPAAEEETGAAPIEEFVPEAPVPVVSARVAPAPEIAGEYSGAEDLPPVPELEPVARPAAPILLEDEDLGVPPVPEPTPRGEEPIAEDFEVPPVPPPTQSAKKFVSLEKVMGGKAPAKQPAPIIAKVAPVKPVTAAKLAPVKPVAAKLAPVKPVPSKIAPVKPVAGKMAPAKPAALGKIAPVKPVSGAAPPKPAGVSKAVPPPLVFKPPLPEVFDEGEAEVGSGEELEAPPSRVVAKPVTFDNEAGETEIPEIPEPVAPKVVSIGKPTGGAKPAGAPFHIKPPTPDGIKPAPGPAAGAQSKKTSLSSFIPKFEEGAKGPEADVEKAKSRRSAIPFLGASKGASPKGAGFVPFSAGGAGKEKEEGGKGFLNVFVPTVDQVKKGEVQPAPKVIEPQVPAAKPSKKGAPAPKPAPSQPAGEEFIICSNCGHKLNKAYKFCNRCGARVK